MSDNIAVGSQHSPPGFTGLDALALRLGVEAEVAEPDDKPGRILLMGEHGRWYDLIVLFHALADRLDAK